MPKGPGICGETPSKSSEGGQGLGEGMGSPGAGVEEEAAPGLQKAPRKRCCPRWLGGQRSQPPLLYGGWAGGERMPSSRPSQVSSKVILYDRPAASLLWFLSFQPGPWGLCWELGLGHSSPSHCPGPFPSQGPVHATSSTGGQLPGHTDSEPGGLLISLRVAVQLPALGPSPQFPAAPGPELQA